VAHEQFILQNQFQELGMREVVGRRLLQAHVERASQAGQTEFFEL